MRSVSVMSKAIVGLFWIFVLSLPGLGIPGPKTEFVTLAIIVAGFGGNLALLASGLIYAERTSGAPSRKARRYPGSDAAEAAIRSWTRVPLPVLLVAEVAIIIRIRELSEHHPWLGWFDQYQSAVTRIMSAVFPAVARIPDMLARETGVSHRADLIQDCMAWGYLAALVVLLGTGPATLRLLSRGAVLQTADRHATLNEGPRGLLGAVVILTAGSFFFATGIYHKKQWRELFPDFETNNFDLVYRATFGPLIEATLTAWILVIVIRSYRGLDRASEDAV